MWNVFHNILSTPPHPNISFISLPHVIFPTDNELKANKENVKIIYRILSDVNCIIFVTVVDWKAPPAVSFSTIFLAFFYITFMYSPWMHIFDMVDTRRVWRRQFNYNLTLGLCSLSKGRMKWFADRMTRSSCTDYCWETREEESHRSGAQWRNFAKFYGIIEALLGNGGEQWWSREDGIW